MDDSNPMETKHILHETKHLDGSIDFFQFGVDPDENVVLHVLDEGGSGVELGVANIANVWQTFKNNSINMSSRSQDEQPYYTVFTKGFNKQSKWDGIFVSGVSTAGCPRRTRGKSSRGPSF